jgi:hypothetical protein
LRQYSLHSRFISPCAGSGESIHFEQHRRSDTTRCAVGSGRDRIVISAKLWRVVTRGGIHDWYVCNCTQFVYTLYVIC